MSASLGPEEDGISDETLIERARREGGAILANLRRREFAPRESIDAWRQDVARGDRARAFLSGEFWKKDLEPMLRGESRIKPCNADALPTSLESAAVEYLFKSGSSAQADRLERVMKDWVAAGEKSAVKLKAEAEKRKGVARG